MDWKRFKLCTDETFSVFFVFEEFGHGGRALGAFLNEWDAEEFVELHKCANLILECKATGKRLTKEKD